MPLWPRSNPGRGGAAHLPSSPCDAACSKNCTPPVTTPGKKAGVCTKQSHSEMSAHQCCSCRNQWGGGMHA